MTLEQLRIFAAVARCQHVTRAAQMLGLTQSAVSASISALETNYGTKLFDRIGRRIELSEAGHIFLPEADSVLRGVDNAVVLLNDLSRETRGKLRLHASQTVASYWLPTHMLAMHEQYPNVDLELTVANTARVAQAVSDGSADLGFVEGGVAYDELLRQVVARDSLVLVVASSHPLAQTSFVAPQNYHRLNWILREQGSGTRSEFEAHLHKNGMSSSDLKIILEFPSNEAVLAAVVRGQAVSVVSRRAAEIAAAAGLIRMVRIDCPERTFSVLSHPQRHRTRAVAMMLKIVT